MSRKSKALPPRRKRTVCMQFVREPEEQQCEEEHETVRAWEHTLTVDASVDVKRGIIGIGIVVQKRSRGRKRGPIVDRIAEAHTGILAGAAEEFAVLRALEVATERGFSRIKIRSDYNQLRRALKDQHQRGTAGISDELRSKVLRLAAAFEIVHFAWVPRRKNQLAHNLARQARTAALTNALLETAQPIATLERAAE